MKFNSRSDSSTEASGDTAVQETVSLIHDKGWMQNADEKVATGLSLNERTSLNALIAYVALHSGENEFRVERRLSDRFNIANMTCLPADQYDDAIRYLVDGLPVGA
jgi:hypothetical protein